MGYVKDQGVDWGIAPLYDKIVNFSKLFASYYIFIFNSSKENESSDGDQSEDEERRSLINPTSGKRHQYSEFVN